MTVNQYVRIYVIYLTISYLYYFIFIDPIMLQRIHASVFACCFPLAYTFLICEYIHFENINNNI